MMHRSIGGPSGTRARNWGIGLVAAWFLSAGPVPAEAQVVFSALEDGGWRLYRHGARGNAPEPIPTPDIPGDKAAPRLSPDGSRVAFEVTGRGLYVCPIAGGGPCRLIEPGEGYAARPAWNPQTGALVFARYLASADEEVSTLYRTDPELGAVEPVIQQTGIQDFPDLSPDGRRLAYSAWLSVMPYRGAVRVVQQLWTLDLPTGRAGQLLLANAGDIHPRWSPDGRRLAFASNRNGRYEIWSVSADGANLRQETEGPGDKTWPVWSPDGAWLLFTHVEDGCSGLSAVRRDDGVIIPYRPFGSNAAIQLKDADWRAGTEQPGSTTLIDQEESR